MNPIHLAAIRVLALLAADPTPAPGTGTANLDTPGIVGWCAGHILPIIIALTGTIIAMKASKGETGKALTTSGLTILGLAMAIAGVALIPFGNGLVHLFIH